MQTIAPDQVKFDASNVIVSFNTRERFQSVFHKAEDLCLEILIADNHSSEGSP